MAQQAAKHLEGPLTVGESPAALQDILDANQQADGHFPDWLLIYTLSGKARLHTFSQEVPLSKTSAVLLKPSGAAFTQELHWRRWRVCWVRFQPREEWREHLDWPDYCPHVGRADISSDLHRVLRLTLKSLYQNHMGTDPCRVELDHNLFEQFLLRASAALPLPNRRSLDGRIAAAREYIESHYVEQITIEQVAAAASLSPSRLSTLFREQVGMSVMGYRTELRLSRAAHLLLHSNLRISEVSAVVGYREPAQFSRLLRKYMGMSPRDYRKYGP